MGINDKPREHPSKNDVGVENLLRGIDTVENQPWEGEIVDQRQRLDPSVLELINRRMETALEINQPQVNGPIYRHPFQDSSDDDEDRPL